MIISVLQCRRLFRIHFQAKDALISTIRERSRAAPMGLQTKRMGGPVSSRVQPLSVSLMAD